MAEKKIQRTKIIPDQVFHKLLLVKENDEKSYISTVLNTERLFNYKKYGLDYMEAVYIAKEIYRIQNISFREIVKECKLKKSSLSHLFCIPIRTVEEWFSGNNRCPIYMKIMILRYYHKINLGKYIKLRSEIEYEKNKPLVYQPRVKIEKSSEQEDILSHDEINKEKEERIYAPPKWYEYQSENRIIKRSSEVNRILSDTEYIDRLIKKRKEGAAEE